MVLTTRLLIGLGLGLACAQFASGGIAENGDQQAGQKTKMENVTSLTLEQLLNIDIVTAAKHAQKLSEAPSTVTVITAEQIALSGQTTLADLLKGVAGMDVLYASERKFAVSARGLSGGTYSKRMLFLMDGRPINQPSSGEGFVGNSITLDDIRQIEVIRGPGSSLYGGNAFAGVVNIITKGPDDYQRSLEARGSFASYNHANGSIALRKKVGDLGLVASAAYQKLNEDGIWNKWYGEAAVPDYFKSYDLKGRAEYRGLVLQGGYNSLKMPTSEKGQYTSSTPYMRYEEDSLAFGQAVWSAKVAKNVTVSARSYYNAFQIDKYDRYNVGGQVKSATGAVARTYVAGDRRWWKTPADQTSWGGGAQLDWAPVAGNRVVAGADYLRQHIDQQTLSSTTGLADPAQDYYSDRSISATGAFVQDEQTLLGQKLVLTGGIRLDKYSVFDLRASPRLSAVYRLHANATLRATYGTAFRIPSLAEYYYSLYYYSKYNLGWQLVPERIHTYELAGSYTFPEAQLSVSATVFRNEIPNMIMNTTDRIEEQYPMAYFYYNFGSRFVSQGLELEAERRFGDHLLARANYTYQHARDAAGGPMVEAPDHKFNVSATFNYGRLSASTTLTYVGPRYDRYYYTRYVTLANAWEDHASSRLPSYQLLDLRVVCRLQENLSLEVAGRNLLDQKYYDTGHNGKYDDGYLSLDSKTQAYTKVNAPTSSYLNRDFLNPGRTLQLGVRVKF